MNSTSAGKCCADVIASQYAGRRAPCYISEWVSDVYAWMLSHSVEVALFQTSAKHPSCCGEKGAPCTVSDKQQYLRIHGAHLEHLVCTVWELDVKLVLAELQEDSAHVAQPNLLRDGALLTWTISRVSKNDSV